MSEPTARKRVLTLVHGTFSPRAPWTQVGSEFLRRLAGQLDGETVHRRIEWRGFLNSWANNGHRYRLEASTRLVESLKAGFREHPDAEHWVISHSHGGNVAFYALRDPEVAGRLDGIVTMATPFIRCQERPFSASVVQTWTLLFLSLGVVLFPLLLGLLAKSVFHLDLADNRTQLMVIVGAMALLVPLFVLWTRKEKLPGKLAERQRETFDRLVLPAPVRQRILVSSIRRDEAGIVLKAMWAVAGWPHWLWNGLLYGPLLLLLFLLALVFGGSLFSSMSAKAGWGRLGGAFDVAVGWGILIGFAHLLVMTFLPKLTRALGLGFGQESLLDNLLVDIRSEIVPESCPTMSERHFAVLPGGWLAHSRIYQSEEATAEIARFIAGRDVSV